MEILLEGSRIRSWRKSDEGSLVRYANNRKVWINLRDRFPHPYRRSDARAWLDHVAGHRPETNFAIDVGDEAVGGIGFHLQEDVHFRSAEMGYWLGEPFWGKGIATQAVRALTAYAFRAHDLDRIFAFVFEWNPASARVLEKAGFSKEGRLRRSVTKDGRTIDQFLYAILAGPGDSPADPSPPEGAHGPAPDITLDFACPHRILTKPGAVDVCRFAPRRGGRRTGRETYLIDRRKRA